MSAPQPPIVALDTETDGLGPDRQVWEVAWIRRDDNGLREEHFFLPIDLATSDPKSLDIGGYYDRHPEGRRISRGASVATGAVKTPLAAARLIAQLTYGAVIVGATPNFDTEVLDRLLRAHGLQPAWSHRLRCVTTLTAGHLRREVGGLAACAEAMGVPLVDAHTALGDARAALGIYDAVMGGTATGRNAA